MNKLKRVWIALSVLIITSSMSISTGAFAEDSVLISSETENMISQATAYDPCDVDHSGSVVILDVISVNNYLRGKYNSTQYNRFDANRNGIVDSFDSTYIMENIVGLDYSYYYVSRSDANPSQITQVSFPNLGNNINLNPDANVNNKRWYSWATYSGTSFVSDQADYYIQPTSTPMNSQSEYEVNAKVGDIDSRYFAKGTTFGEITGVVDVNGATGFIVGDHEIVTAAHVVFSSNSFKSTVNIKTCNSSGKISNNNLNVQQIHVPKDTTSGKPKDDYALIVVANNLSGYTHFTIGEAYNVSASIWNNVPIYVTGQPDYYNNSADRYFKSGKGKIYDDPNADLAEIYYTTDTYFGSSGAPIYTIMACNQNNTTYYYYTVLGVHSGGNSIRNRGAIFTKYHREFLLHNPKDPYLNTQNSTS